MSYGFLKFDKGDYGWLNPYYLKTVDGDTHLEHLTILSKSSINELTKDIHVEFYQEDFVFDSDVH